MVRGIADVSSIKNELFISVFQDETICIVPLQHDVLSFTVAGHRLLHSTVEPVIVSECYLIDSILTVSEVVVFSVEIETLQMHFPSVSYLVVRTDHGAIRCAQDVAMCVSVDVDPIGIV